MYVLTETTAIFLLKRRELIIDPAGLALRTCSSGAGVPLTPGCSSSRLQQQLAARHAAGGCLAAESWLCLQGKCQGQPWLTSLKDHISSSACFHQPSISQAQDSQRIRNWFSMTST